MKIEIVCVEKKDFEEVHIMHIYPPHNRREENIYRRYGPDHWTHYLGTHHQFLRYAEPEFLETKYQDYMRKHASKPKAVNK